MPKISVEPNQTCDLAEPGARRDHGNGPAERGNRVDEPYQRAEAAGIDERDSGRVEGEVEASAVHCLIETLSQLDGCERVELCPWRADAHGARRARALRRSPRLGLPADVPGRNPGARMLMAVRIPASTIGRSRSGRLTPKAHCRRVPEGAVERVAEQAWNQDQSAG